MTLTVVMPVYNELGTIEEILRQVQAVPVDKEIVVVDDCSTDGTREKLLSMDLPGVRVLLNERNMLKGSSVKKGIAAAQGDFIIVQDADLEYDPQDYLPLLEAARGADVFAVIGSRMLGLKQFGGALPPSPFNAGRALINLFLRALFGAALSDSASCYKLARREVLQGMKLRSASFDLDFELSVKFLKGARRAGKRVVELPIHYAPRTVEEGKKIRWRDGLAALWTILKFRFVD